MVSRDIPRRTRLVSYSDAPEWFTLTHKDKFSGKVYLELTFWSNVSYLGCSRCSIEIDDMQAPPPEKKMQPKPAKIKQYAGPGSFVPSGESVNGSSHPSRIVSASSVLEHSRHNSDTIPGSLKHSGSLARLDLYSPSYEHKNKYHLSAIDQVTNEFQEFGVSDHNRRRESFPVSTVNTNHVPEFTFPSSLREQDILRDLLRHPIIQPCVLMLRKDLIRV